MRSEHEGQALGPLEVSDGGDTVSLGGHRQCMVLAVLLLHANRVVSVDRFVDGVWGESPPPTARKTLQAYVARLRRTIGEDALTASNSGYVLRVEADDLDSDRFEGLAHEGRQLSLAASRRLGDLLLDGLARNQTLVHEALQLHGLPIHAGPGMYPSLASFAMSRSSS